MINSIVYPILSLLVCFVFSTFTSTTWAQSAGSSSPTFRMSGAATLSSDFIEQGLTQTEHDPNLQGEFWFNFGPQFRMGLWGSNVRYDDTATTHFWLKLNADVKVDFGPQTNMVIKYTENKYYKANNRDGNTVGLHLDLWGYKLIYETDSNWEGTDDSANYLAIGKDTPVGGGDYIWNLQVGYTMPDGSVTSYFDARTGIGKKLKDIFVNASASYSTVNGSLKDRGDLAFLINATVKY